MNEVMFGVVRNIVDDVYVHTVLSALQEELGTALQIKVDGQPKTANLSTLEGRKEFVTFVETEFIPALILGKLDTAHDFDDKLKNTLRSNTFIKALSLKDFNIRNKSGNNFEGFGVTNFKSSDNSAMKGNQNELMMDLYGLKDILYNGNSIIDILFLYNTIIHRGKDGENTLSSFFDPDKVPGSIVNRYYD